jgi:hypothetical protein
MAKQKDFAVATDVKVYVSDPQSPWQRGTKENTNLLLQKYFPRGTDLSPIPPAQLDQVSLRLTARHRVPTFECVDDGALCDGRLKVEFDFDADAHGSVWTSSAGILT